MIDEIFFVHSQKENRYYQSRRAVAKAAVEGYLSSDRGQNPAVVRFQRVPGKVANSDIGPEIREYLIELPNYVMSSLHERSAIVDAMESKINELLD